MRLSVQKLLAVWLVTVCTAFTAFGQNDLSIDVTTSGGSETVGTTGITYTVTLNNEGATSVTGVAVTISVPDSVTVTADSPSAGSYAGGVWTIGNVANTTASETLTLTVTADGEGVQTLVAEITAMNEFDGDSDPTDNSAFEDDIDAACFTVPYNYCEGETPNITANAPAGYSNYQWFKDGNPIVGATSANYTITEFGNFSYTTDVNTGGCVGGTCCDIIVTELAAPVASISDDSASDTLTCSDPDIALTASGGTGYSWSNGASTAGTTVTTPGTYTVTVTGANGCTATSSIDIFQDITPPTVSISDDSASDTLTCADPDIALTASGGSGYSWSNGASTAGTTVTTPGTYTVTVTGANGCTATSSIDIFQDITPPTVSISDDSASDTLTCSDPDIALTASGGTGYSWSNGASTAGTTVTTPGTYTVTVTGANGCTATSSIDIFQDITPPTAGITPDDGTLELTCDQDTIPLTATGGASYAWSTGDNTASAVVNSTGTYTVTVTAANGCTATSQVTVTEDITPPTAGITPDDGTLELTCDQDTIPLTATGGASYAWSTGDNTASAVVNSTGTYTVTVTAANGCTATSQATVTEDVTPPTAGITPDDGTLELTCDQDTIPLTATGGASYAWSTGDNMASAVVNTTGTYTVTVTAANGCTATSQVTVTEDITPPTAGITPDDGTLELTCLQDTIPLTGTGGGTYAWSTGANTTSVVVNTAGNYTVTVTAANGCTATSQVTVTENTTPPTASISDDDGTLVLTCVQDTIPLTASGGVGYAWSTGASTSSIVVNSTGTYTVTVTALNGCTSTADVTVTGGCTVDYGDLPDSSVGGAPVTYNTTQADGGPSHGIITGLSLGGSVDAEADGQPSADASGDGADDDGVTIGSTYDMPPNGTIRVPLSVTNTTGDDAYVVVWIDWNGDGDFDDPGEQVESLNDSGGPFPGYIEISIPAGAETTNEIGMIVRVSNSPITSPDGYLSSGEVETYMIDVTCPTQICLPVTSTKN